MVDGACLEACEVEILPRLERLSSTTDQDVTAPRWWPFRRPPKKPNEQRCLGRRRRFD